jgi:hypothetical protein
MANGAIRSFSGIERRPDYGAPLHHFYTACLKPILAIFWAISRPSLQKRRLPQMIA